MRIIRVTYAVYRGYSCGLYAVYTLLSVGRRWEWEGGVSAREVEHLEVAGDIVEGETHQCAGFVPSVHPASAWIEMEEMVFVVAHHLEDVAVTGDEEGGVEGVDEVGDAVGVVPWVASDVGHEDAMALSLKHLVLWGLVTYVPSVDVAIDSDGGFEVLEAVKYAGTDVPGMPNFIDLAEERIDLLGQFPVCVGHYS